MNISRMIHYVGSILIFCSIFLSFFIVAVALTFYYKKQNDHQHDDTVHILPHGYKSNDEPATLPRRKEIHKNCEILLSLGPKLLNFLTL